MSQRKSGYIYKTYTPETGSAILDLGDRHGATTTMETHVVRGLARVVVARNRFDTQLARLERPTQNRLGRDRSKVAMGRWQDRAVQEFQREYGNPTPLRVFSNFSTRAAQEAAGEEVVTLAQGGWAEAWCVPLYFGAARELHKSKLGAFAVQIDPSARAPREREYIFGVGEGHPDTRWNMFSGVIGTGLETYAHAQADGYQPAASYGHAQAAMHAYVTQELVPASQQ